MSNDPCPGFDSYAAVVAGLASTLDLEAGLADALHVLRHRQMVSRLAEDLDLEAGLNVLLESIKPAGLTVEEMMSTTAVGEESAVFGSMALAPATSSGGAFQIQIASATPGDTLVMSVTLTGPGESLDSTTETEHSVTASVIAAMDGGGGGIDADGVDRIAEQQPAAGQPLEVLVRAAQAGDRSALNELLTEIHPLVLRYCRGRLGRQETAIGSADDVAQEVCLAVISALPSYTIKGLSFRAFVFGIAAHKVTDAFRMIGRNREEAAHDIPDTPARYDEEPEYQLISVELNEELGRLLRALSPRQQEVIALRLAAGLSAEETADAVRSTAGAVRVTQHRALNRLRMLLAEPNAS